MDIASEFRSRSIKNACKEAYRNSAHVHHSCSPNAWVVPIENAGENREDPVVGTRTLDETLSLSPLLATGIWAVRDIAKEEAINHAAYDVLLPHHERIPPPQGGRGSTQHPCRCVACLDKDTSTSMAASDDRRAQLRMLEEKYNLLVELEGTTGTRRRARTSGRTMIPTLPQALKDWETIKHLAAVERLPLCGHVTKVRTALVLALPIVLSHSGPPDREDMARVLRLQNEFDRAKAMRDGVWAVVKRVVEQKGL